MPPPTHHRAIALIVTVVVAIGVARTSSRCQRPANPSVTPTLLAVDGGTAGAPRRLLSGPIDPNTADPGALEALPGVGPALARRIIAARTRGRVFRQPDDLLAVRGIGPRTVARLAPWLRFAAAETAVADERNDTGTTNPSRIADRTSP